MRRLRSGVLTSVHSLFIITNLGIDPNYDPEVATVPHFDTEQPAYKRFRSILRERTRRVVAWTGSGLSVAAGLPTWIELKHHLLEELGQKAKTLESTEAERLIAQRNAAAFEPNLWIAFTILRNALQRTSYTAAVRDALETPVDPVGLYRYEQLWKLPLAGLLNLNLDRLATQAFVSSRHDSPVEFPGIHAARYTHLLQRNRPFIANLHGTTQDDATWVLTHEDLKSLIVTEGYKAFVRACILTNTLLFLGISADDVAAGGHLADLQKHGISAGDHFWLTDRVDANTDKWAEAAGIQVIRYSAPDRDHSALDEFIADLLQYLPKDEPALPVVAEMPGTYTDALPSVGELASLTTSNLRNTLNAAAGAILSSDHPDRYLQYEQFCENYDPEIHRAWYVSTKSGRNDLFDYQLQELVGRGAFGRVYTALAPNKEVVAIKVLHEEVRTTPEMLQGFRRGVHSMRILTKKAAPGVVRFLDAGEIPAFAVMEYVEGPTLAEAVDTHRINDWTTIVRVGVQLAEIIRKSHQLPERVLHRDIRPANVIIRNGWSDYDQWEIVVTDFDLSWNRDAIEKSIGAHGAVNGYLAPEQVRRIPGVSTRNAAVDSYGLGMTLYFLATGRDPLALEPSHAAWSATIESAIQLKPCAEWKSLPTRYFRLICSAVREAQSERVAVPQIESLLREMQECLATPEGIESVELLVEELAAKAFPIPYVWDADSAKASFTIGGLSVSLRADELKREATLDLQWNQTGQENYENVRKWIPRTASQIASELHQCGFRTGDYSAQNYTFRVSGQISKSKLRNNFGQCEVALKRSLDTAVFRG